ncbi:MAG: hypothetical protein JWO28_1355 [Hyphomicrobiales bacterium]|jgi:hypothetical protein|nr:hypothetical protein [Hyphomicrobiales bacterium]
MRKLAVTALILTTLSAPAQARLNTMSMTCDQAKNVVVQQGAVILGNASRRFDRYVATRAYCTPQEIIMPDWIATRDNPKCFVGYRCKDANYPDPPDGGGFNWRFD